MIARFKYLTGCYLLLLLQLMLSPIAAIAAAEVQVGVAEPITTSTAGPLPADAPEGVAPVQTDTPSAPPVPEEGTTAAANPFFVPEKQGLAELVGRSEVSVSADADGQFVSSIDANRLEEEEPSSRVGESTLLESIRTGRSFNRESLAALTRLEQAKAQSGQAFALLLPSVTVRGNRGYETSAPSVETDANGELVASDTHMRSDASLTVRQPLFDLPGFFDWRRRKTIEEARKENYRVSDSDAYIATVSAYLALVSSRLQADVTRDFEAQLAELLSYIEKRAKAGAASVSDMARVRARSQATRSSRLEQESAHAASGIEFVRLTNVAPQTLRIPVLDDLGASLMPATFTEAVAKAMESNPDIAVLKAELQAARIEKAAAKGRFLPRIDAEYTDTYSHRAGGAVDDTGESQSQRDKRSMLVASWTLFSGGSDYHYHAERSARHTELKYRLDDERRSVVQSLSANYATLATTSERIASGYQELKAISTAAEAMSKRMLSGNQSLLDLLDVYDRHYQVRSRLITLHLLEMNTVAQIVRLTLGTPWPPPEKATPVKTENRQSSPVVEPTFGEG